MFSKCSTIPSLPVLLCTVRGGTRLLLCVILRSINVYVIQIQPDPPGRRSEGSPQLRVFYDDHGNMQ